MMMHTTILTACKRKSANIFFLLFFELFAFAILYACPPALTLALLHAYSFPIGGRKKNVKAKTLVWTLSKVYFRISVFLCTYAVFLSWWTARNKQQCENKYFGSLSGHERWVKGSNENFCVHYDDADDEAKRCLCTVIILCVCAAAIFFVWMWCTESELNRFECMNIADSSKWMYRWFFAIVFFFLEKDYAIICTLHIWLAFWLLCMHSGFWCSCGLFTKRLRKNKLQLMFFEWKKKSN